ncbi:MAG: hypothetical protein ACXU8S_01315 [Phenylobacterium sp.]
MPTRERDPRDFGTVRRFGMIHVVSAVVVLTAGAGLITFQLVKDRQTSVDTFKAWQVKGPPCPSMTEAEFTAKHLTALKTFDYDGTTIGRTAGDVSCSDVKSGGGKGFATDKVCQFTSPATLTVTIKAAKTFFAPGVGQPASLYIHHDVPSCIMASNFTLQNEAQ